MSRDFVLLLITSIASAISITSLFVDCRPLAWIAIVISDSYLSFILLFAAIISDDDTFATRHPWMTSIFPHRRTAGLFVAGLLLLFIVSGFAGLYVGAEVFQSSKTPADALYTSFLTLGFTDFSPKPGYGQFVVIGQLASGVLYVGGVIPLLISRIATFRSP